VLLLVMKAMKVMMTVKGQVTVKDVVKVVVKVFEALLKVTELFSLSSPLTRTQTTTPQTHPCGA